MHGNVGSVITWGICQIHHCKPKVNKNEPTVLIRKHFLSRIHWEINISIVTIISKYAKFKVYTAVCCDAWQYNAGQFARGRLTPWFLTPYFKTFARRFPELYHIYWPRIRLLFVTRLSAFLCHWYSLIFSCDQAALWMVQSVCPSVRPSVCLSVRPSVCHTFLTMFPSSYHHEIFRSYYQWQKWRPCKRSRSEVKGQGHRGHDPNFRFRTVTPVWIHIWWWNDTYSLMLLRRGALLFFKVIRQISRSHGVKIAEFDPDWAFPDCNSSLNSPMATKWCTKLEVA